MSEKDLSIYNYAASDSDGGLWVYGEHPIINGEIWDNPDGIMADQVTKLSIPPNWKEAMIKLCHEVMLTEDGRDIIRFSKL